MALSDLDTEDGNFHDEEAEGVFHHGFDRDRARTDRPRGWLRGRRAGDGDHVGQRAGRLPAVPAHGPAPLTSGRGRVSRRCSPGRPRPGRPAPRSAPPARRGTSADGGTRPGPRPPCAAARVDQLQAVELEPEQRLGQVARPRSRRGGSPRPCSSRKRATPVVSSVGIDELDLRLPDRQEGDRDPVAARSAGRARRAARACRARSRAPRSRSRTITRDVVDLAQASGSRSGTRVPGSRGRHRCSLLRR